MITSLFQIFRTLKIYREGDSVSACFSLGMWCLYAILAIIMYSAITGDKSLFVPFLVLSMANFLIMSWSFYLIWKSDRNAGSST